MILPFLRRVRTALLTDRLLGVLSLAALTWTAMWLLSNLR